MAPPTPAAGVERPRLRALLTAAVARPLTLVSAPAGWGKTALLSEWVASDEAPGPVAWVGLGREDRERVAFWRSACAALAGAHRQLTGLPVPPRGGTDALLTALVNAFDELGDPVVLVLDDFHDASSPDVLADLDTLAEHAPSSLRLVLATRVDPPLRLQRLRLGGRLGEVRAADLALSRDEARAVCRAAEVELDERALDLLLERTEGWPAGVRLAALSLAGDPDPHAFLEGFAGGDRGVGDYLVTEVLSRQPPERLDFLLRTSVSERICGELAEALTGDAGARATIAELASRHGLVTPLDSRGEWYRYSPLLGQVLRLELARLLPTEVDALHRRAARWHAERGDPLEAIRHAIEAAAWDVAADTIGHHWLALIVRGEGQRLRQWLERMPDQVVEADAELALAAAGLRFDAGEAHSADALMATAQELAVALPKARRARFGVTATATALYRARLLGDVEEALAAARAVLDDHWDELVGPEVRALTLVNLGMAELVADEVGSAEEHLHQAAGLAAECENDYLRFLADAGAAVAALREGRMESGRARATRALELADRHGWTKTAAAALAQLALAATCIWAGDLEGGEALVERAASAAASSHDRLTRGAVALMRSRVLLLRGRPLEAVDVLRAIRATLDPLPPAVSAPALLWEAEAWLALGEPERSRALLESPSVPDVFLSRAQLELVAGEPGAALRELADFHADERESFMPFGRCQAFAIEALAHDALRGEPAALRALERSLDLAEPRGYASVILRLGPSVRSLLRRAIAHGTAHRSLADDLLAALDGAARSNGRPGEPLLEPLSERELAVLRFLPTMLSNAEIAAEMFVSPNTVKTHLKHVYRKLDVADRKQAVRRARELHLLSPSLGER